jgi:hypothetical protein
VKTALDFVMMSQHKATFMLLREKNNHNMEYIQSLSQQFQDGIGARHGQIIDTIEIGPDGAVASFDGVSEKLARYSPQCVLYIGQLQSALELLRVISTNAGTDASKRPLVLVSDSAVGDALLYSPTEVYAMFPVNGEQYRSISHVYGADAFALVSTLIKQVNDEQLVGQVSLFHRILNMHRVQDARAAIIRKMQQNADYGKAYTGTSGRVYRYVAKYELQNVHFHVWKIRDQKIVDVDSQDGVIVTKNLTGTTGEFESLAKILKRPDPARQRALRSPN